MLMSMQPFYQTNTAGHCTLYAVCHNGSRGRQTAEDDCPQYCRKRVFLYPDHLHMIGRYNSLVRRDLRILTTGRIWMPSSAKSRAVLSSTCFEEEKL